MTLRPLRPFDPAAAVHRAAGAPSEADVAVSRALQAKLPDILSAAHPEPSQPPLALESGRVGYGLSSLQGRGLLQYTFADSGETGRFAVVDPVANVVYQVASVGAALQVSKPIALPAGVRFSPQPGDA